MNSKKQAKKEKKKARKKNKLFYKIFFILGLFAFAIQVYFYRKTIIDIYYLLSIILLFGILVAFLDRKKYDYTFGLEGWLDYVFLFMQNLASWGGLLGLFFLSLNFYFPKSSISKNNFKIIDTFTMTGSKYRRSERKPVFVINYLNEKKELVYPHKYLNDINEFKTVTIETQIGLFGFDIISNRVLNK
ncbi:hypothetical protein [Polaribacter sp. Hel_I_88]|uniref:hypothetical protein n=1 Tax=Polaribacter sp. Hel_I_88 TaxID=1250006 RepID=UPI00047EC417|nr:hypothetical protein [Polaribacter sp. Hel_I_88]